MLRAVWTGQISFGLVSIPVKAIPAQSSNDIRFELLHGECHSKTTQKRYCPKCERDVANEEMVRAFQYAKGQFVVLEPADFESLDTPTKRTLQILDFVEMGEVDPVYYEKPYYLQPSEGGERTYGLLHRAMVDTGRVGIGKVALRDRESIALIRPVEHALVMELLSFPDEVRALDDAVPPFEVKVDERELKMAEMLIGSLAASFDPAKYQDDYRLQLTSLIEQKVEGGAVTAAAAPAPAKEAVSDLMEMLRRSVEAASGERAAEPAAPAATNGANGARKKKELTPA